MTELGITEQDGMYVYDGCHYDTRADALLGGVLGFCLCGQPEEAGAFVARGLELIEQWRKRLPGHEQACLQHFGSAGAAMFFYYWADNQELTEHGGSVPGWLSFKGELCLQALKDIAEAGAVEPLR